MITAIKFSTCSYWSQRLELFAYFYGNIVYLLKTVAPRWLPLAYLLVLIKVSKFGVFWAPPSEIYPTPTSWGSSPRATLTPIAWDLHTQGTSLRLLRIDLKNFLTLQKTYSYTQMHCSALTEPWPLLVQTHDPSADTSTLSGLKTKLWALFG